MECLKIKRLNQQIMVRSRVWNVNKEKLIQALSFQSISSLVNQFLYKNPPLLLVPLLFILFPIFWTFLKAARRNVSLSSAITLPSTEAPSNGIEINTQKSRLHANWHFTRTVYHWSLILKSFRAKPDDANGFLKALYWILASLNSRSPVQKSNSCACAKNVIVFLSH